MAVFAPVIIEAAINGATTPDQNPHVPRTPQSISEDAARAIAAGAAIVHNHLDDPGATGRRAAELYLAGWRPVLREKPGALFYPTAGVRGSFEERYGHEEALAEAGALRIGLVDPGSVNLASADEDGVPAAPDFVYVNAPSDIASAIAICQRHGLAPTISIFEPGFLRVALAVHRAGKLPRGAMIKLYFGGDDGAYGSIRALPFGLPPTRPSLEAYLAMLEGSELQWSVAVLGGDVVGCGLARLALERGGHVRVGLEDYAGPRQPPNEELVREAAALARDLGRRVATSEEAAGILGLVASTSART